MDTTGVEAARDRIRRIFKFLEAFNEKKNPVIRQLSDQPQRWLWSDIPEGHPGVEKAERADPLPQSDPTDPDGEDLVLRVQRVAVEDPPAPPPALLDWLEDGWDDPRRQLVVRASQQTSDEGVPERFDDAQERADLLAVWRPRRDEWADEARDDLRVNDLFGWLFEIHGIMQREAERFELVLADGVLNRAHAAGGIHHPILLQRLQFSFNATVPDFVLTESERPPELYTALVRQLGVDGGVIAALVDRVQAERISPLGAASTDAFLAVAANSLSPDGEFIGDVEPAGERPHPRIGRAPVLILRNRAQGFADGIAHVLEDIETREDFPAALKAIAGVHERFEDDLSSWAGTSSAQADEQEVLLSKPANPEQLQIARRLDRYGAVLVQGPPGTGKTHTIANLIGDLLAKGKSVLVTSHTTRALRVLREQVAPELQPLCVTVLEGDSKSREQLADSVTKISGRVSSSNLESLREQAATLRTEREAVIEHIGTLRAHLFDVVAAEYEEFTVGAETFSPAQAATLISEGMDRDDWISGLVTRGARLPLSSVEVEELYRTNASVSADEERLLDSGVADPATLLPPGEFARLCAAIAGLRGTVQPDHDGLWLAVPERMRATADLRGFAESVQRAVAPLGEKPNWYAYIVAAAYSGGDELRPMASLADALRATAAAARAQRLAQLNHDVVVPAVPVGGLAALQTSLAEMSKHVIDGGGFSFFTMLSHRDWKTVRESCTVDGRAPATVGDFRTLLEVVSLGVACAEAERSWSRAFTEGAPFANAGGSVEATVNETLADVEAAIGLGSIVLPDRMRAADALGLRWEKLFGAPLVKLPDPSHWQSVAGLAGSRLPGVIEQECERIELKRVEAAVAAVSLALDEAASSGPSHPVAAMREAVKGRDPQDYEAGYRRLVDLHARNTARVLRSELLTRLAPAAPDWADAIARRSGIHAASEPPGEARAGWKWKQLALELDARCAESADGIIAQIAEAREQLRNVTVQLIDRMAWAAEVRRTSPEARQALGIWLAAIKRIGKGSGKNVPRLRRAAQEQMAAARSAVPVWIGPLSRVVESFDPRERHFDVVIVDEASQSDVLGLLAFYLADQVMIVGDDQQVTPAAVGDRIDDANSLIDAYLQGIPGKDLYDGKASIYQLASTSFTGVTALREHFRCVPDIIQFSNDLSYDGEIRPLRDGSTAAVQPPVICHQITSSAEYGDAVNRDEALEVAALVVAATEQPEYEGLSMGVIALEGTRQPLEIETILRSVLPLDEMEQRRILCGTPPQFQGDERDVVFLSLVTPRPDHPPLGTRSDIELWKQRYNVAVSRARDQLWVVHSLRPETDLKPGDIRRQLLDFARDPGALSRHIARAVARSESPLEAEVAKRLITQGYKVEMQRWVGGYRLDIVVGDDKSRVALECDGDRFHTSENLREDLERQALLERLGWRFVRLRGTEFFRDPDSAMVRVHAKLDAYGVVPADSAPPEAPDVGAELRDRVVSRAAELREEWDRTGVGRGAVAAARQGTGGGQTRYGRGSRDRRNPRDEHAAEPPTEPDSNREVVAAEKPLEDVGPSEVALSSEGTRQLTLPGNPDASLSGRPGDSGYGLAGGIDEVLSEFRRLGFRTEDNRLKDGAAWVFGPRAELWLLVDELNRRGQTWAYGGKRGGWYHK